jgi:signal transduction histidine kinase
VRPRGAPEIRKLISAVNDMQSRIAALVKGRTMLLGAISHDLKTYITRLRLRAEGLDDERRERATRDLEDMTALIDDAIAVARGATVSDRRERVDLMALVRVEAAERPDRSIEIEELAQNTECTVLGDPVALHRVLANLLDNALRHGTRAAVSVDCREQVVAIAVDDDGPGIPDAEREAVFEPFYRLETSRSRTTGGSGLGLAIVRQIVAAHGGTIAIGTSPLGGARLALTLPRAPEAAAD